MVELGRVDIAVEVSQLPSFLVMPSQGHFINSLHTMSCLRVKHNSMLVLNPSYPGVNQDEFKSEENWKTVYGNIGEALPPNAPKPLGKEITLCMFVDLDHAGDKSDRRSRTGFMIFMNMAMIQWHSEKQATVESAVCGAVCVAMK